MSELQNHPKLLMQINRQQPVPKLVSINQYSPQAQLFLNQAQQSSIKMFQKQKQNRNFNNNFYNSTVNYDILSQQHKYQSTNQNQSISIVKDKPNHYNSSSIGGVYQDNQPSILHKKNNPAYYTTLRKQLPITQPRNYRLEVINLQRQLQIQKQQNFQLQQIIKQLTINTQKLKQVNQHLVQRLKQLQKSFIQQRVIQQRQQQQKIKKAVNKTYQDVQAFIRQEIQVVSNKLKGQKMTPLLEKKLELFMETMLQINQNTVEMLKLSRKKNNYNKANALLNSRLNQTYTNEKENFIKINNYQPQSLSVDPTTYNFSTGNKQENRSSKKKLQHSPDSHNRRLINNSYISSYKKNNQQKDSHIVIDSGNKEGYETYNSIFPQNSILKHLQNRSYFNTNQNTFQQADEHFQSIVFKDKNDVANSLLNQEQLIRKNKLLNQSHKQRKKYYQTTSYDQNNFKIKQYTPSKRKRIFGEDRNHSKSRTKNFGASFHD